MIEDTVPPGSIDFAAESSLSLLSEPHLRRLKRSSFKTVLPALNPSLPWVKIEDRRPARHGQGSPVSGHVNLILKFIPYIQTNFVLGLDTDEGPEPSNSPSDSST